MTSRLRARELARTALISGDAVGWFDTLYTEAGADASLIPWADLKPHRRFVAVYIAPERPTGP
jgi:hypothetical protein